MTEATKTSPFTSLKDKIRGWLTPHPDRKRYATEYRDHLHNLNQTVHRPLGFIISVIWLDYAFNTDPQLHPDMATELFVCRMTFSAIGLLVFIASFFEKLRGKGMGLVLFVAWSASVLTGFLTGLVYDDANYMSGYQLIIVIVAIATLTRRMLFLSLVSGLISFAIAIAIYREAPDLADFQIKYSFNNLFAAVVMSVVIILIFESFQFRIFLNNHQLFEQKQIIEEKHNEVTTLKEKQDGDYFLTSILMQPLMVNENKSERVKVDYLIDQYKKFHFRGRDSEIGGDICASHSLTLRGKEYTLFINGDAMGKSIQGAGGALVLGTVYNTLVSRTQNTKAYSSRYPEQWLKECFLELQDVFVSFDGSMLISCVIGLVDNETGFLYFINSEHPWIALYRDRRASFIENELLLRKIGVMGIEENLQIRTFPLQPGDRLLCGSDGRDDVLLGYDDGTRIINEDETEFLKRIEEGEGDPTRIREAIKSQGPLTDDFTLMSIHYDVPPAPAVDQTKVENLIRQGDNAKANGKTTEAIDFYSQVLELTAAESRTARDLYWLLLKKRDLQAAVAMAEDYSRRNPGDSEFLYLTSYALKLLFGKNRHKSVLASAIDYGERGRLRTPKFVKNLINLADCYRLDRDPARAKAILEAAKNEDPENDKLKIIDKLLAKSDNS